MRTRIHLRAAVGLAAVICIGAASAFAKAPADKKAAPLHVSPLHVLSPPAGQAQTTTGSDVAIVVHPETPVDALGMTEMRKVFRGDQQYWKPNMPIVLLVRAPGAYERDVVLRVIYQMTEPQFKQYWIAKIFRAEATSAPKIVFSNDVASQLVSAIPGAVGFMPARDVRTGVKVLRVEGRLPGEPGYVLRLKP